LEDDVWDEEDQVGDVLSTIVSKVHILSHLYDEKTHVSKPSELKLLTHSRNVGSAHVGSIHKRHTVHSTDSHNKTTIDASNDAALLILGEATVDIDLGTDFAGRLVDVPKLGLLLNVVHV
jgi:hypothetical protein